MKRTFATATYLGCVALLAIALQSVPLHGRDTGKDKTDKTVKPESSAKSTNPPAKFHVDNSPIERQSGNSYAPIIKKAAPSVVSVFSSRTVPDTDLRSMQNDLLRRFFGGEAPDQEDDQSDDLQLQPRRGNRGSRRHSHQETGLGSGVIVTEDGYILTNNHVIEDADDLKVVMPSGVRYTARVIGADSATDTALIKIEGTNLPAMTLGDSDAIEVGDVVLAIGNPFDIGQTVTMGIVSAIGRTDLGILGQAGYEDFIQTDAAINLGNSGGALMDTRGRLVGINSAILSRTGGNVGVGFAVPINMARLVMESLTQSGHVSRGYLGIAPRRVTPELARHFDLPEASGALVDGFPPNGKSVARDAGIKPGDVIIEFNGKKIKDDRQLRLIVSQTPPNTDSTIKLIRDGKEKTFKLKLAELPTDQIASRENGLGGKSGNNESLEGVTVDEVDSSARSQFRIPSTVEGALVTDVDPDSKSYEAGLRPGDVIMEINHKPVRDAKDAVTLSENAQGPDTLLRIFSRGNTRFMTVENGVPNSGTPENKDGRKNKSRR